MIGYDFVVSMARKDTTADGTKDTNRDNKVVSTKKRKKKESNAAVAKRNKSTKPSNLYWHDVNDPFIIIANENIHTSGILSLQSTTNSSEMEEEEEEEAAAQTNSMTLREQLQQHNINLTSPKSIKFIIRGNPRVLIRHRTARGFVYNPSKAAQENFKDCLLQLLPRRYHPTILDDDDADDDDDDDDDNDDDDDDDSK